jgi:glycosyltransferase involved in cell wall biosynthesis
VTEFVPTMAKDDKMPGVLSHLRPRYILPLFALWQALKLATRAPGLLGSWRADITWLERDLLPGFLTLEPLLSCPLVFDVDDAIWTSKPFGSSAIKKIAKKADVVMAGNDFLADWFSCCAQDVRVVPTAIDTTRFFPSTEGRKKKKEEFVIGWTGTGGNLAYVYSIEKSIGQFLRDHPNSFLHVLSDRQPQFTCVPSSRVRFTQWSFTNEAEIVRSWDVGIMPLPDSEFARGKCGFKMLQYMACGLPVVVSPIGMNREILRKDDVGIAATSGSHWFEALSALYADRTGGEAMGLRGRAVVEANFSTEVVSQMIAEIFKEMA